jgi:hypothetical protein
MPFKQIDDVSIINLADEHMHARGNIDYEGMETHPSNLIMSEMMRHQTAFARILVMPNP